VTPLVSIGVPVYNGQDYLAETIESLLSQTWHSIELILADNASADRTEDICRHFVRQDSRLRYYRHRQNVGVSRNYNFTFRASRGTYFKWAAVGDQCAPTLIAECVRALEEHSDAVVCYGRTEYDGDVTGLDEWNTWCLDEARPSDRFVTALSRLSVNNIYGGVFRSSALRQTSLERNYPAGDLVLLAELALLGRFVLLPSVLHVRRMSAACATPQRTPREVWRMFNPSRDGAYHFVLGRKYLGFLNALCQSPITLQEKSRVAYVAAQRLYWNSISVRRQLKRQMSRMWLR
jgi:glycosyltransferase involved in cell wall biosynthesis